jgi:hypothetical protein
LLLLVTQRRPESYAEQVASLLIQQQSKLGAVIDGLVRSARVEVDPQYGSWNRATSGIPRVEPNQGPPAQIVPNPSAILGPRG